MSVSDEFFDPFELIRQIGGITTPEEEWAKSLDKALPLENQHAHLKAAAKLGHQEAQLRLSDFYGGDEARRKLKWLLRAYWNKKKQPGISGEVCFCLGEYFTAISEIPAFMRDPEFVTRLTVQSLKYFGEASEKYHHGDASEVLAKHFKKKELNPDEPAKSLDRLKWYASSFAVHLTGRRRYKAMRRFSDFAFSWPLIIDVQTSERMTAEQLHSLTNLSSIVRIAGLPGTGKTTLAKWIAWSWSASQGPFAQEWCICYIPLARRKGSLYSMVKKHFDDAFAMPDAYSELFLQAYGRQILFVFDDCESALSRELDPVICRAIFFCCDNFIGSDLEVSGFASLDDQLDYIRRTSRYFCSPAISRLLSKSEDLRRLCVAPLALDILCYLYERPVDGVKLTKSEVYLQFVAEFVTARFDHKIDSLERTREVLQALYTSDWSPGIETVLATLSGNWRSAFIESGLIVIDRDNSLRWYDTIIPQVVAAFQFVVKNGPLSALYSKTPTFWQLCNGFIQRSPNSKARVEEAMRAALSGQPKSH